MEQIIFTKIYPQPPVDRREILRYMRCGEGDTDGDIDALLDSCLAELLPLLVYKVCWRVFPLRRAEENLPSSNVSVHADVQASSEELLDLGFLQTNSRGLARNLQDCEKLVLFAATVGLEPDRLLAKYGRVSPVKALCMQAIGAERIESLCDAFCGELQQKYAAEGLQLKPRFSPGYGDFPLETQKAVFQALDCPRKIGLSLNDSLLMSPSKSVTALAGLFPQHACLGTGLETDAKPPTADPAKTASRTNCAACDKADCLFRQT